MPVRRRPDCDHRPRPRVHTSGRTTGCSPSSLRSATRRPTPATPRAARVGQRARERGSERVAEWGSGAGRAEGDRREPAGAAEEGGRADHRRGRVRVFRALRTEDPAAHDPAGVRDGSATPAGSAQKHGRTDRPDSADELAPSGSPVDLHAVGGVHRHPYLPLSGTDARPPSTATEQVEGNGTGATRSGLTSCTSGRETAEKQPKTLRPSLSKRPEDGSLSAETPCFRAHRAILRMKPPRRSARNPLGRHRYPVENRVAGAALSAPWRE